MKQRTNPICIECGVVIFEWIQSQGNRPLFCSDPVKKCRLRYKLREQPLCARPGCHQPFTPEVDKNGRPNPAQRYCSDHRYVKWDKKQGILITQINKPKCRWCGKIAWQSGRSRRFQDYCSYSCKQAAWSYPGQPQPHCAICGENNLDDFSDTNDPSNYCRVCWQLGNTDKRMIIDYFMKGAILSYKPTTSSKLYLDWTIKIGLPDLLSILTPSIRPHVLREFQKGANATRGKYQIPNPLPTITPAQRKVLQHRFNKLLWQEREKKIPKPVPTTLVPISSIPDATEEVWLRLPKRGKVRQSPADKITRLSEMGEENFKKDMEERKRARRAREAAKQAAALEKSAN